MEIIINCLCEIKSVSFFFLIYNNPQITSDMILRTRCCKRVVSYCNHWFANEIWAKLWQLDDFAGSSSSNFYSDQIKSKKFLDII